MKSYYEKLGPIVMQYVKSYITDYTEHDRKALDGYTGEFFYAIRQTGTNIFCVEVPEAELQKLIDNKPTSYFTARGLKCIHDGFSARHMSLELSSILSDTLGNDRFFIGKNGKITEVSKEKLRKAVEIRLRPLQRQLDALKGSIFVANLSLEIAKQEAKDRWELNVLC